MESCGGEDIALQRTIETAIRLVKQKREDLIEQAKISEQDAVEVFEQLANANLVWRLLTRAANLISSQTKRVTFLPNS